MQFGQGIVIPWIFTVADINKNIIGMDFIKQNNLLVHPRESTVVFYDTQVRVKTNSCPKPRMSPIQVINADVPREIEEILQLVPELTATTEKIPEPKHSYEHKINVEGEPITDPLQQLFDTAWHKKLLHLCIYNAS